MKKDFNTCDNLTIKELSIVFFWFVFRRRKWKHYDMLVESYYFENVAYRMAKDY
tara:strand:- start:26574 stop:26735 length:162 start_codon:yes stop_codon:yes gene_type:complete